MLLTSFLALLLAPPTTPSQTGENPSPPSSWNAFAEAPPTEWLPVPDVERYLAEDQLRPKDQPLRYGALLPVDLGPHSAGRFDATDDGSSVWRLTVRSPGAQSLGLEFSRFDLPPGAELFVRTLDGSFVLGPYHGGLVHENGRFAIQPVPGDALVLELLDPSWASAQSDFSIDRVVYDYRGVLSDELDAFKAGPSTAAGSCNVDVKCPAGLPYADIVRSAARTLASGSLCSGALINNTRNDGAALFLTANHCGSMTNAVFLFNYQKSGCNTGSAPTNQSLSGSTLLAASSSTDYRLVRLNQAVPSSFGAFFAGWDRTGNVPSNTIAVHHPSGDVKKISFDNNPPQKQSTQWRILQWDLGVTEGGSSGSPLFNAQKQIIGQLCCGAAQCGFPLDDYYGRFDLSFSALKPHLDPINTNATTLAGFDPAGGSQGTPPVITAVSPAVISAIKVDAPQQVTLTGTGFTGITEVKVDGVVLTSNPPQYAVLSSTQIALTLGVQNKLGNLVVSVKNAAGTDTDTLAVAANLTPTLEVLNSQPGFVAQSQGISAYLGSLPNDLGFFLFSTSTLPTNIPGVLSAGIGNNGSVLYNLATLPVSPLSGWVRLDLPLSGNLPFGTQIHIQAAVLRATNPVLPLVMSNVQSVTLLL